MEESNLYLVQCHLFRNSNSKDDTNGLKIESKEIAFRSRSRYLPEDCEFRNGFVYNNNMLALAGETIAAIAGSTLQNMVCIHL